MSLQLPLVPEANLLAAWAGVLLGMLGGAVIGLFFHRQGFLGGYDSWPRRAARLGHISFFGLAFVNFAFVVTVNRLAAAGPAVALASWLLIAGAVLMPAVCFASAWRKPLRRLFVFPTVAEVAGVACVVLALVNQL